jgi:hypothetical protein
MKDRWKDLCCPLLNLKSGKIESLATDFYFMYADRLQIDGKEHLVNLYSHKLIDDGTEEDEGL